MKVTYDLTVDYVRADLLARASKIQQHVLAVRAERDAQYEARWRKRWYWADRPETSFPEPYWPVYPSQRGWGDLAVAEHVMIACNDELVSSLTLTEDEHVVIKQ